jgi:hypothetical protein
MMHLRSTVLAAVLAPGLAAALAAQEPRPLQPIPFENSAEFAWLAKDVLDSRPLDDMTDPGTWEVQGTGALTFPGAVGPRGMPVLRVDMEMFTERPAPTRNGLSAATLRRPFAGEDWSGYNRLSLWIRADVEGFPMLPLQIVLHNEGETAVPDAYYREGIHYVTLEHDAWQQVVWEIEPFARDRVTAIQIGYWVNKMLAAPGDRVGFEIGRLELQRVEPDHYAGWSVAPGRIAYSHTGYEPGSVKDAFASDLEAAEFRLIRVDDSPLGDVVLAGPVHTVQTRLGTFQRMDFTEVRRPGRYVLQAGDRRTRPFTIHEDAWRETIEASLNFLYGQRCGYRALDSHGIDHRDFLATHGDLSIVMNGGWHDAGDLSQGLVNTGAATYSLFALAERLQELGEDPALIERVIEEAVWGLEWVLKVRFDGGYRIGFAGNNLWTNGIIGDADDRTREARNNPHVNYLAAAAAAIGARLLADRDPELAARSLGIAEDDWRHAVAGVEGPETWSTPAYAAPPVVLAGLGVTASLELYRSTGLQAYADQAIELARTIVESQQKEYVGTELRLAGFFYNSPARDTLFHQYHMGNDQAPIVALADLVGTFPDHPDWMDWYATVALYARYKEAGARTTEPYGVLAAYVYRDTDHLRMPDYFGRYQASADAFRDQVLQGLPIGDGYYLRAFPVWFARRGNYGVLLAQAKAVATAARVRGDGAALDLARRQARWIVGQNPFAQSTMYGVGYDWAQQYSVSSGDMVGSLPVGMQSHGVTDRPYWPGQNMYVYKEVWVHPAARWLWLMADLAGSDPFDQPANGVDFDVQAETGSDGTVTLRVSAGGEGAHVFEIRAHNLEVDESERSVGLRPDPQGQIVWRARASPGRPWVAVVIPNGHVEARREVTDG